MIKNVLKFFNIASPPAHSSNNRRLINRRVSKEAEKENEVSNNENIVQDDIIVDKSYADRASDHMKNASRTRYPRRREFVVTDDISNGKETYKIPAVSFRCRELPPDFHYVTHFVEDKSVIPMNRSLSIMRSCNCKGPCIDGKCYCASTRASGKYYDYTGLLDTNYNFDAPEPIFECNSLCGCNAKKCQNRAIQNAPIKTSLILFKTKSRGWGVRTLQPIERGTFIGVYSGELLTVKDSQERVDDTYLFNLAGTHVPQPVLENNNSKTDMDCETKTEGFVMEDEQPNNDEEYVEHAKQQAKKDEQDNTFICDAKFYGNFTRFINHSCEPNLIGIRSFTTHQDQRFPYIAFFTNKFIGKNTELTLNYGDNYWIVKCARDKQYCRCKVSSCKFTERTFPETYKIYQKSQKKQQQTQTQK